MRRKSVVIVAGVAAAFAGPGAGVAAADFTCPVLGASGTNGAQHLEKADVHNKNLAVIGGGDWSTLGPDVGTGQGGVPDQATNTNPDGTAGDPTTENHARPGDRGYTAIWNTDG